MERAARWGGPFCWAEICKERQHPEGANERIWKRYGVKLLNFPTLSMGVGVWRFSTRGGGFFEYTNILTGYRFFVPDF